MKVSFFIYRCSASRGLNKEFKKMFDKVELSVSSYDTAWMAMVPCPNSPQAPFFPSVCELVVG